MYLRDLHIDRFGIFRDQGLVGLGPGLTVFLGPNESGKSTLLELIRWVLFGPGQKAPPPSLQGERSSGRLRLILEDGRAVLVERVEGQTPPDFDLLDGLDRRGFERIFALGLDDLQGHQILDEDEQRGRLPSAGQDLGGTDLRRIRQRLEKEIRSCLTQRGTRAEVHQARTKLKDLEENLRQTRALAMRHTRLGEEKEALEVAEEERRIELETLAAELCTLEKLDQAMAPWKRWQEAESDLHRLSQASAKSQVPAKGVSRRSRRAGSRLPEVAALLLLLLFGGLGVGLYAFGLLPFAGAGALTLSGGVLAAGCYFLLHRGHQRMILAREARDRTLEAHRHRSTFEALTESDPGLLPRISTCDPAELEAAIQDNRQRQLHLREEAKQSQQRIGAMVAEMEAISAGRGPDELLLDQQIQRQRLARAVRRWATAVLTLDILDEAFRKYAETRMPRILDRTGALVSEMVGEELRLVAEPEAPPHLEGASLVRRGPNAWSSGLGDQAYLAMRLALAQEMRRDREPIPFLLDDVLVRLDPQRQIRTLRCLLNLSSSHQILLFSSRPSLVRDLRNLLADDSVVNPSAHVVRLVQGVFSEPIEAQDCD